MNETANDLCTRLREDRTGALHVTAATELGDGVVRFAYPDCADHTAAKRWAQSPEYR